MKDLANTLKRLGSDRSGTIAVQFAILLPVLVMLVGGTIDYGQAVNQRTKLQEAVDKAALAAARELGLSDARRENVQAAVEAMVYRAMSANTGDAEAPVLETTVRNDPLEVEVAAQQMTQPFFGSGFGLVPQEIHAHSVARVVGRPNICVLGLDPSLAGTISLEKSARVTGQNCAVFSNSTHTNGIKSKNSANLTASLICSAGGREGLRGNFTPAPLTDCPTFDDPLAGRPEPEADTCETAEPKNVTASITLSPGTYCGGLVIENGASVTLEPGIYAIKNGELRVRDGASLSGVGVGFYFTGDGAVAQFERQSTIDLEAPSSGLMAGLLMFEGRNQPTSHTHQILSDDARNLLGTLYLSRGRLHVDANNPVADKSAYTAIVARMLTLYGGPHLVLNSNYELTNVPVPAGIRGASQPVSLVK